MSASFDPHAEIAAVPACGYRWWYVDGLSDDGRRGFTAIFLVGSVFSPSYASRVRKGERVPATDHLGVHVALYEDGREVAWGMSEYPRSALSLTTSAAGPRVGIGRSWFEWGADGAITGEIDERTAPVFWTYLRFGSRIRGRFRLRPLGPVRGPEIELGRSPEGEAHHWQVRAPLATISVQFDRPGFSLSGRAYHDSNWGAGRLEAAFARWAWSRVGDRRQSQVLYAVEPRGGAAHGYIVRSTAEESSVTRGAASFGPVAPLKWGLHAPQRFDIADGEQPMRAEVARVLDRTPFYSRYVARVGGVEGVGEYLDLDRFVQPGVQFLLHFRTQRR